MALLVEVIKGLEILAKYTTRDSHAIAAGHDVIYAGPGDAGPGVKVSPEDATRLNELGWLWNDRVRSWMRFV